MEANAEDADQLESKISTYIQLFSSLFCASFVLRKSIIFETSKLVLRFKLSGVVASRIYQKIVNYLKCDANSLMDTNSLVHLIMQWQHICYKFENFPWYFVGCTSIGNFVLDHWESIVLAILKHNTRTLEEFCKQIEMSPKTATEIVLSNCFAFLLPIEAGCLGIKYEAKAEDMKQKISNFYSAMEQKSYLLRNTSSVIAHVLENVVDRPRFAEICGFETEIVDNIEMIDCANFDKCLKHLRTNFSIPSNQSILTFFCSQVNMRISSKSCC